jgi:hypothetical protein
MNERRPSGQPSMVGTRFVADLKKVAAVVPLARE